ncbi:hypothetical protein [Dyella ginsengisoli]|uniref:hypothetical protein n=1 Tax=Dyella ginsengisoli TaxID=363848 RepID=UPI000362AFE9|nr:hypothetical protein [Dyella ginsengisoli]
MNETVAGAMSVDQYQALQLLEEGVIVQAEEIRFTAYRPAGEMSVRFKLPTANGRPRFLDSEVRSYRDGVRLITALYECLTDWDGHFDAENAAREHAQLRPDVSARLKGRRARVCTSGIKERGHERSLGFVTVLTFAADTAKATRRAG